MDLGNFVILPPSFICFPTPFPLILLRQEGLRGQKWQVEENIPPDAKVLLWGPSFLVCHGVHFSPSSSGFIAGGRHSSKNIYCSFTSAFLHMQSCYKLQKNLQILRNVFYLTVITFKQIAHSRPHLPFSLFKNDNFHGVQWELWWWRKDFNLKRKEHICCWLLITAVEFILKCSTEMSFKSIFYFGQNYPD